MLQNAAADRLPGFRGLDAIPDVLGAAEALRDHRNSANIVADLSSSDPETVKLAIGHLTLYGNAGHARALAVMLHHHDPFVVKLAENALWSIWMRAGSDRGNLQLRSAVEKIGRDELQPALRQLNALIAAEPGFAEAHHQRGIVCSLLDDEEQAEASLRRALDLNPLHFEARAGLGHLAAGRGDPLGTLEHYRAALKIHPTYEDIRLAVREIERALERRRAV